MKVNISIVLKSFEVPEAKVRRSKTGAQQSCSDNLGARVPKGNFRQYDTSSRLSDVPSTFRANLLAANDLSIRLPKKQSLYTVLRSPHIDKKSREQFDMKIHKQLIRISVHTKDLGSKLFHLKFHETSGVQMKVIFHYKTRLSSLI